MIEQIVYTFPSADGVSSVHCRKWLPDGQPKALLQICHGMIEYIERYDEFATYLAENGFVVAGHDHIGHGQTAPSDAELGIMHSNDPSATMVDDIYSHYELLMKEYPSIPYFILGHSMGSYLLRKFLSVKAGQIDGIKAAIIMGTGTEADSAIKAGKTVLNIMSKFKGWDYRSKFVVGLMYGAPYKEFDTDGTDLEKNWLSTNVESNRKYYQDKYCTYMFSLNGYRVLLDCTGYDNNVENIKKMDKDMPIMFVSGACDPVGGLGVGVQAAYDKFKQAGIKDVSIKLYDGMRHEILNEVEREKVYSDLKDWMLSLM